MLNCVTPVILTFNEAPNIERTLSHLAWAKQIVVVDSYSTDETLDILKAYSQVQVFQRQFDTHANQWNYGLQQVQTQWILALDADYELTNSLVQELSTLSPQTSTDSYAVRFQYCVFGQPLRGAILPPRTVLFRKDKAIYIDDGHTQLLQVNGNTEMLSGYIRHDDRKPLSRWLWAQDRYAILEAQKLRAIPPDQLSWSDRIRRYKVIAPLLVLFYCLILRRGILDGQAGWYYAFQRMLAETLLSIHLLSKVQ
ncbi:MAG: glycosyltransferase family 2 protein [Leptolyngbyaceae cyanobacterium CRU_2_3]|nr:glycosyltransferase family 2 protein [Leptolyngbyaceae cyanobacterium CRU_2_3]